MTTLITGIILLLATAGLFVWGLPTEGQPSPIPNKWGIPTLLPIVISCLGIAGLLLIAKSVLA